MVCTGQTGTVQPVQRTQQQPCTWLAVQALPVSVWCMWPDMSKPSCRANPPCQRLMHVDKPSRLAGLARTATVP